jgi:hypothetical protein
MDRVIWLAGSGLWSVDILFEEREKDVGSSNVRLIQ